MIACRYFWFPICNLITYDRLLMQNLDCEDVIVKIELIN